MYKLRDKIIAVVSNEPWGDIWYSKHNWAFELSQTNRVFFLNPAGSWKFSNLFNPELHSEKISDGLEVLTYANRFPLSRFSMIRKLNEKSTARQLKKRLKLPGKELLFWSFDPYRLVDPKALEATNSLYFITDDFTNELEKELVKNVDCLITVSPVLSAKYPAKNTLTLAHGISSEEFRADPDPETQNGILYIGNIDHRIDYQLLIKLILAFPEEQFYFIGKLGSNNNPGFRELFIDKKYPNLIHRPPVHFKRLKQHIAGAKVCLAIMQTEVAGNNINHHKLLQYLAQGKPVLSPVFEDYSEHTELILGYKNPEEAISLLQQAIEVPEYSELIQNRITFAQKHTYPKLINQIEQFLTETECFLRMNKRPVHIVEVMADPNSITYFNLFAERSKNHPEIKLSFICLNDAEPPVLEDMKERGCDSYWVKFDASNRVRSWIGAYFQLKKLLKQLQPDVVHSHLFDDGVPTMMAAKSLGIRKRIHTKQSTTFNWFYAPKAVFLDRLINRKATHLIAVSTEARQFLIEKERADAGKIRLIHHGISFENLKKAGPEEVSEFKAKFQLEGKRVIGTVSRYIKWKGYIEFIEAASLISDKYPDVVFMGVGSGSQEDELRELIRKKGLEDRFILTGWIDKKHIPAVFQSLDIYLHAAFMEPFGFVIPEAMINKVPIVTTPTGSALDGLTHLESAYIAPYNNVEALAAGMEYFLVNNRPDMVEKAYHSALEKYSINNMWENHLKLYLEA